MDEAVTFHRVEIAKVMDERHKLSGNMEISKEMAGIRLRVYSLI